MITEKFSGEFRFKLGTDVWLKHKDKHYQGRIIKRGYLEKLVEPTVDNGMTESGIDKVKQYSVWTSNGELIFNEYSFNLGDGPFTSKQEYIDKHVFIR